jgi:hypothetical protein
MGNVGNLPHDLVALPMFPLTVDGIEQGVKALVGARPETARAVLAPGSTGL